MAHQQLDLQRIRRNWEKGGYNLRERPAERLGAVEPPLDPYVAGAALLERLRRELSAEFPEQQAMLAPFLLRVSRAFEAMRGGEGDGREQSPGDVGEPRQQFCQALSDLEEICEAFLVTRP